MNICPCNASCPGIISHTVAEWASLPDEVSKKGVIYVFSDYRTDNEISIPRIKIGDGTHRVSKLAFATMSIADSDIEYWDEKPDRNDNDFGKIVTITESYTFPSDGYLTLEFIGMGVEHAEVRIYGASGKTYFTLSKFTDRDNQSKEVLVRKGMKCLYVSASANAMIKFYPLV